MAASSDRVLAALVTTPTQEVVDGIINHINDSIDGASFPVPAENDTRQVEESFNVCCICFGLPDDRVHTIIHERAPGTVEAQQRRTCSARHNLCTSCAADLSTATTRCPLCRVNMENVIFDEAKTDALRFYRNVYTTYKCPDCKHSIRRSCWNAHRMKHIEDHIKAKLKELIHTSNQELSMENASLREQLAQRTSQLEQSQRELQEAEDGLATYQMRDAMVDDNLQKKRLRLLDELRRTEADEELAAAKRRRLVADLLSSD